MAVDDPTGFNASLPGRVKAIEERLDALSATPIGKVKFATGWSLGAHPVITPTPYATSVTIDVPALATSCGYSVFASGVGENTGTSAGYMSVKVEVSYGTYDKWTYQSQSNVPASGGANVTVPMVDTFTFPAGGGTLTLTASVWNDSGSWTNTSFNSVWPEGLFVFQY